MREVLLTGKYTLVGRRSEGILIEDVWIETILSRSIICVHHCIDVRFVEVCSANKLDEGDV